MGMDQEGMDKAEVDKVGRVINPLVVDSLISTISFIQHLSRLEAFISSFDHNAFQFVGVRWHK